MRLTALGRVADLQWFKFADGTGHELALHLLCPWRLSTDDEILVGHSDYWRPATADTPEGEYERAVSGSRWRDVRRDAVVTRLGPEGARVERLEVDAFGGFSIRFEGGLRLESFPDATRASHDEIEFWRLFQPGGVGEHFVVSTDGIDRVAEA